jgi:opacity protein-like surface antigen
MRIVAVALAAALAAPAMAQSRTQQPQGGQQPQIGVGAGITSTSVTGGPDTGMLIFVPIQLAAGQFTLRIEPYLGWARYDTDADRSTNATFPPTAAGKGSDFVLGIGGFLVHPVVQQLQIYGGGRLASEWQSYKAPNFKAERRNTILALAGGAEYLPIPRVAFGAEFQIGYVSFGDTKYTVTQAGQTTTTDTHGGSGTATQATLFARFFFL